MTLTQFSAFAGILVGVWLLTAMFAPMSPETPETQLAAPAIVQRDEPAKHRRAPVAARSALIIPVTGVAASALTDTWGDARSEGRTHEGIDILAPLGTPVRAAADGRIVKFFESERGGVTIYQFDASERFVYYYAHLNSRAANVVEGDMVRQGDIIGYVGMTGNAPIPHLHFEIQRLTPAHNWWQADSMNPYPFLRDGRAPT